MRSSSSTPYTQGRSECTWENLLILRETSQPRNWNRTVTRARKLYPDRDTCGPWSHELRSKSFKLVRRCHQLLSRFLAKGHLLRISHPSANGKDDNVMIPGVVHRSPGICFTAEGNPGQPQPGDRHVIIDKKQMKP